MSKKKAIEPFFNRELSWLEFNHRVLAEGLASDVPLLDRLKFLAIVSTNLDEFFMIRVAGIIQLIKSNSKKR
ncbi:MAG: RNA degradosome polyphosphate kinase, partial [Thermogutta sp.]|nr:RNA degradosome polyphosphate kinase [Thermogutta sp.]